MPPFNTAAAVLLTILLAGCQKAPASYDDCILINLRHAETKTAIAAIEAACRGKFPVEFKWDELAKKTGFKVWSDVKQKPEFQKLSKEEQRAAKEQYWNEVLKPQVRSDFLNEAHDKFMSEK